MDPEMTVLSEASQTQKDRYHMTSLTHGIQFKNDTYPQWTYLQSRNRCRRRQQTCSCQGWESWEREGPGVWDEQMQTLGWINTKVLLYSAGTYVRYPVIPNGKEYEYMHVTESLYYTPYTNAAL